MCVCVGGGGVLTGFSAINVFHRGPYGASVPSVPDIATCDFAGVCVWGGGRSGISVPLWIRP